MSGDVTLPSWEVSAGIACFVILAAWGVAVRIKLWLARRRWNAAHDQAVMERINRARNEIAAGARPPDPDGFVAVSGVLTGEELERFKRDYEGALNAGRPMTLEGGKEP